MHQARWSSYGDSMLAKRLLLSVTAVLLVAAGCGDDDDDVAAGGSVAAYCELAAELNTSFDIASDEALDELIDVAPAAIRADVETVVGALRDEDPDAEGLVDAESDITAFEEEECGGDTAIGHEGDDDSDVAPAVVTFVSPKNGDSVSNPITIEPNVVRAEIAPAAESASGQGHYHVMIDTACLPSGNVIPKDGQHLHFGDGSTTLVLPDLTPGEHELCLQLGNGQHEAFGAASTITVTVE
jgi:hypothetical protein